MGKLVQGTVLIVNVINSILIWWLYATDRWAVKDNENNQIKNQRVYRGFWSNCVITTNNGHVSCKGYDIAVIGMFSNGYGWVVAGRFLIAVAGLAGIVGTIFFVLGSRISSMSVILKK